MPGAKAEDLENLKKIEAGTGKKLRQIPIEDIFSTRNGYACDEGGNITGLNLYEAEVADISFLRDLPRLIHLDLSYNQITDLSPLEVLIQRMEIKWELAPGGGIFLEGNPLEIPPVEIVKQGSDAVRNYFKEIEKQTVLLLHCKLLLVGSGAVGKTTLMKKLKDPGFEVIPNQEPTTHGINIIPWQQTCTFADGATQPVKIHFWDFGGQDIMYTTHQFFLTKRSLYLFVWEARREGQETASFDYWLNIIKLLSADSPVIIVMNKSDTRTQAIDEASMREKFANIRAFFQVSCLTGAGMPALEEKIRACLAAMKHLQDKLPKAWMDIRNSLKKQKKDYISLREYFTLCAKHGLNRERALFLSDYLHDLGVILHFRSDALLENTVILNPEWATAAVYRIMDTKAIIENKGRFQYGDLKTYWDRNKFPEEKHPQLLRLMEKFELCFPVLGSDIHIVPELLPAEKPRLDFNRYSQPGSLHFEYFYEFMPRGILSRFISRLYYLVKGEHFWKSGVELALENTSALVLSEPLKRKLSVSVSGPDKSELLAIIRHHLDYIHRSLNMTANEHYSEMIPCGCSECLTSPKPYLFPHQDLKKFIDKRVPSIQCRESAAMVLIAGLLKGVAPPPQKTDLKELLPAIIKSAARLQGRAKAIRPGEDDRNSFVAELLTAYGYIVKDQTRRGTHKIHKNGE